MTRHAACFLIAIDILCWHAAAIAEESPPAAAAAAAAPTLGGHPTLTFADKCANCHDGNGAAKTKKGADHLPTSFTCDTCHSKIDFATFAATAMNHQGIRGNCAQCHLPNTAKGRVVQGGMTILPQLGRGDHIVTSQVADKCEVCHSIFNFTSFAGAKMNHQGINIVTGPCFICHEAGMEYGNLVLVTRPDSINGVTHPPLDSGDCSGCHASFASFAVTPGGMDFPPDHFPTTQGCSLCHNPLKPIPGQMNHAGIGSNCISCHGDQKFAGLVPGDTLVVRPSDHIPQIEGAPGDCDTCHFHNIFRKGTGFRIPPERMNHSGIAVCNPCHEAGNSFGGINMKVRPPNHHGQADCAGCHKSTQIPGGFDVLPEAPAGHLPNPANQRCKTCHEKGYGPNSGVMDHSALNGGCIACHGVLPLNFPAGVGITPKAQSDAPDHDLTMRSCEDCHFGRNYGAGGFEIPSYPHNHMPNPWGQACDECHPMGTAPRSGYMVHPPEAGAAGPCTPCHGDAAPLAFAGTTPTWAGQRGKHIPLPGGLLGEWGTACETCHASATAEPTGFLSGAADSGDGILHKHANVTPGKCNACHRNPLQVAPSGGEHVTVVRAGHQGGASCDKSGCHSVATGFYNFKK